MNYSAQGKFLLSGEYMVLEGATAFAMPLSKGQELRVEQGNTDHLIEWKSYEYGKLWFSAHIDIADEKIIKTNDETTAERLLNVMKTLLLMNPYFYIKISSGAVVNTYLSFNRAWGLGTSSTLISNLADWADVDPYDLLKQTFGGSGYDLACAKAQKPLFFQRTGDDISIEEVEYQPHFSEHLLFVYSGKKSNSRTGMKYFKQNGSWSEEDVKAFSSYSKAWPNQKKLSDLQDLIEEQEARMSKILNLKQLKEDRFPDFKGAIKSLGAWNGDFFLAVCDNPVQARAYFERNDLTTILTFEEIAVNYQETKIS